MRSRTRLTVATMVAIAMTLPVAALGVSAGDREWTVLMYFGADNDLYQATEFGMKQVLKALSEMSENDPNLDKVAFVVLIDGPKSGDTKVYELTRTGPQDLTSAALQGNPERTMTEPETMTEFLNWAIPAYPADKKMLVLKNGHAWCGICPDETDNPTDEKMLMPIDGLREAIEEYYGPNPDEKKWIDALVFDGDNMGSIEVAYELRKVTSYFVASQQQVPLEGLPYYLFTQDLSGNPTLSVGEACKTLVDDYVKYYNNTQGGKVKYDKLLANSQMYVTAAVFEMGAGGARIEAVKTAFDSYLNYMLVGTVPDPIWQQALAAGFTQEELEDKLAQWEYPDPTDSDPDHKMWAWIPLNRNNISSARDCALIGKMNDQQGYEWLPDVYTWLRAISALVNYDIYGDSVPPSGDTPNTDPPLTGFHDPFVRLLFKDFMDKWGYEEQGIYRAIFDPEYISGSGALVYLAQSQILDRSGNSFPHGLNIWFPPSPLQWDDDDAWSLLFTKEMTYTYSGIGVWIGVEVLMPAEYYCIDCPWSYQEIGLDFTKDTLWLSFFDVYYDSRWLIYGGDTGGRDEMKP